MELTQRQQILTNGFNEVMKHYLCGDYIDMSDIEGLEYTDIEWHVDINNLQMVALTEFGTYCYDYDYDFSFDSNLEAFIEELRGFLYNQMA